MINASMHYARKSTKMLHLGLCLANKTDTTDLGKCDEYS